MNRFKLKAFKKEFPFLHDLIGDKIPDSVRIKRADENLLRVTPQYYYHDGSMGRTEVDEIVHFVLADGTIIVDAVLQSGHNSSNYAHSQSRNWEGETVLGAIDRQNISNKLQFIVVESYYLDDWEGSEYEKEHSFCIYKAPKNTTFGAEIKKARAKALAEVRAKADF